MDWQQPCVVQHLARKKTKLSFDWPNLMNTSRNCAVSAMTTSCTQHVAMVSLEGAGIACALHTVMHHKCLSQKPQKDQNENMKSARQSVEMSRAEVESEWPLINRKDGFRMDHDPSRCFAEIRAMRLPTNFVVCGSEGGAMTGSRGFRHPPPTLAERSDMTIEA